MGLGYRPVLGLVRMWHGESQRPRPRRRSMVWVWAPRARILAVACMVGGPVVRVQLAVAWALPGAELEPESGSGWPSESGSELGYG